MSRGIILGDKVDWRRIARCYESGEATVAEICKAFGISQSALYRRRKLEGWCRESLTTARPESGSSARAKKIDPERTRKLGVAGPDRAERRELVRRLFAAWEQRLGMIEQQIVISDGALEVLGVEKQTRALSLLVRDFEKLSGIYEQLSGQAAGPAGQASADEPTAADAEDWREALAHRLERLCEARNT